MQLRMLFLILGLICSVQVVGIVDALFLKAVETSDIEECKIVLQTSKLEHRDKQFLLDFSEQMIQKRAVDKLNDWDLFYFIKLYMALAPFPMTCCFIQESMKKNQLDDKDAITLLGAIVLSGSLIYLVWDQHCSRKQKLEILHRDAIRIKNLIYQFYSRLEVN